MRLTTIIIVVAALAVSVLTAFLIQQFLGSQAPKTNAVREVIPAERVLVAKDDLVGGTVLKSKEHFKWQAWPKSGLRKDFVLKGSGLDKEFDGAVLRRGVKNGFPLTAELVYREGEKGFVASGLKPGMRAVAIKIDPVIGVAGFVTPGDRVDVILTSTISIPDQDIRRQVRNSANSRKVSETIMRNIRVIGINQNSEKEGQKQKKPKSATLEVTAKQVEILANARRMGKLYLALRSHVQVDEVPTPRKYEFTTDLEILSSMRGGLAAHVHDMNRSAEAEFRLDRWITNTAEPETKPVAVVRPAEKLPMIVNRSAPRPKTMASPAPKKSVTPTPVTKVEPAPEPKPKPKPEPAVTVAKKPSTTKGNTVRVQRNLPEPEKETTKQTETPKVVSPVAKVAPVKRSEPATVRIDRAGTVQILKFKGIQ